MVNTGDIVIWFIWTLAGAIIGGVCGGVTGFNDARGYYAHDTRKGTIVCETVQSIIYKGQVYCLTSEDISDSRVESVY